MFDAEYLLGVSKLLLFIALIYCMVKGHVRTAWTLVAIMFVVVVLTEPLGAGQYGLHYED